MSSPEIKKVVKGRSYRPSAAPAMKMTIEVWRPAENLRPTNGRLKETRVNSIKGVEVLVDRETHERDAIVNDGLDFLCEVMGNEGNQPPAMGWTAIGTDTTAVSNNQSNLIAEVMREANTYAKDAPVGQASLDATFNIAVSGYSLNECGLFNVSGTNQSAIMYCRDTYTTKNVLSGDTVNVNYTSNFSAT